MIKQRATLYADKAHIPPEIFAVRNDTGREIVAEIADYTIPSGATAEIRATLPDGTTATAAGTIDGKTVTAPLDDLLTAEGKAAAQIRITNGGEVTTFAFFVDVTEDLAGDTEEATAGPAEVATFETDAALPLTSLVVEIDPQQSGSGTPSPDNVRPITGTERVTVARTGVNVWDEETEDGYIDNAGKLLPAPTSYPSLRSKNFCLCKPSTKYYYVKPSSYTVKPNFAWYDIDKNFIRRSNPTTEFPIAESPSNAYYFKLSMYNYGTTYNHDISINFPSTDNVYHAYQGETVTTDLGRTVYGGTVDIVTGKLTVTYRIVDLGTLDWNYYTGSEYPYFTSRRALSPSYLYKSRNPNVLCSNYSFASVESTGSGIGFIIIETSFIRVRDLNYTDAATFKTAMSGVQLVYELATPQTYQLTPAQILALLGGNTIWSDAGQVTVKYRREAAE